MLKRSIDKQKGIGLLELMLSIAVIAVLLIMATRYYQATRMSQQVTDAVSIIQGIRAAAGNFIAGQSGGYDAVTSIDVLGPNGAKLLGDDVIHGNPWGGDVTASGANKGLTITLSNVPDTPCQSLVRMLTNQAASLPSCSGGTFSIIFQ